MESVTQSSVCPKAKLPQLECEKRKQWADTTADFTTKRSCRNRNIYGGQYDMVHGEIIH